MDWFGLRDRHFWQKNPVLRLSIKEQKPKAIQFILAMSLIRALKFGQLISSLYLDKMVSLSWDSAGVYSRKKAGSKSMDKQKLLKSAS